MNGERTRTLVAVVLLALACATVNLTKPVHMDDTVHLQIAQGILRDPLHPMSVAVNWADMARPAHELNQPHLWFYLLAVVLKAFGLSELAPHVLMAFAATVAIVAFHRLARRGSSEQALLLASLLALGPAFLPGQNLMVDVPLVALWLLFFLLLGQTEGPAGDRPRPVLAACVVSAACLVKYTSLVLLPILVVALVVRRAWKSLWVLAIPLLVLAAWSVFNYADYGGIHLLGRPAAPPDPARIGTGLVDWIAGVGAVCPWAPFLVFRRGRGRFAAWLILGAALAGCAIFAASRLHFHSSPGIALLWSLFYANGILVAGLAGRAAVLGIQAGWAARGLAGAEPHLVPALWILGTAAFVILWAPFSALRHVLLAVPALLLLMARDIEETGRLRRLFLLVVTAGLGLALAVSDFLAANAYRVAAREIRKGLPAGTRVWHTGHWGWQWYATRAGMLPYDARTTVLRPGDFVVVPAGIDRQTILPAHERILRKQLDLTVPGGLPTLVRTLGASPPGGYYGYSFEWQGPPWRISRAPLETFTVYRAAFVSAR